MTHSHSQLFSIYQSVAPSTGKIVIITVLLAAQAIAALIMPWLAGKYVNNLIETELGNINIILWGWLSIMIVQALLSFASTQIISKTSITTRAKLSKLLFDKMQSLPLPWFYEQDSGNILSLFNKDVSYISNFTATVLSQFFLPVMLLIGTLSMMISIAPIVALILLFTIPTLFIINRLLNRHLRPLSKQVSEQQANCVSIVENWLKLTPIIKSFVREPIEKKRYEQSIDKLSQQETQQQSKLNRIGPSMRILIGIAMTSVLWVTAHQADAGHINTGDLVSLLMYSAVLIQPISQLANIYGAIQNASASADRLTFILTEKDEHDFGKLDMPPPPHKISFNNVSYCYPGRTTLLSDYNLTIPAGELFQLESPNGSGKSTLLALLLRHLLPNKGTITINGVDIQDIKLKQLRHAIAYVPQQILLANDTISANIAYVNQSANQNDIALAAKQALADGFIKKLPDGYNTIIGEQGVKLSGGQQQRLALARALLKKPFILLLDEATSMFDKQAEQDFQQFIENLAEKPTIIQITHTTHRIIKKD